ncbi:ATP-dependent DNA ligase [Oxyplasma meridianum]|uniref:DNA ligase n=1 Tax=Oxyplasma meridianum TaxID=3073602 RepID=A0AAX4NFE0_9ARCH
MLFSELTESFQAMGDTRKRLELTEILRKLFQNAGDDLPQLAYLLQGKVLPDYYGVEMGIADKLIIKALSHVSGKSEEEIQEDYTKTGDLGQVAYNVTERKTQKALFSTSMTLDYVYQSLLKISKISGSGSIRVKTDIYTDLILNGTPADAMYITRIVSGKLRLGVSDATILDALALAFTDSEKKEIATTAYNFHPDIGYIADLLRKGKIEDLEKIGPEPMIPMKVMLAERLPDIGDILAKMEGTASLEYKYDGMRAQIHKKEKEVRIFSRSSEETTGQFPDIVKNVLSTFKADSLILDGEAVPFNPETGDLYPFQAVSQRRGRKYHLDEISDDIPIVVFLFDILYKNGEPLQNLPYLKRREILKETFQEDNSFKLSSSLVTSNKDEAEKFIEESISSGCEGIVAKNITDKSIYRAGSRGWLWIKYKRDYEANLGDSLDLVVIGAFSGHGRRKGTYGALLMASYNNETGIYQSVCKLGTGFTDDVLFNLPKMFSEYTVKEKPANVQSGLIPDIWIIPNFVMEIVGSEITLSPIHSTAFGLIKEKAGLAIRFPRFTGKWRNDKRPDDATTVNEIINMYKNQKKNIGNLLE